MLKDSWRCFFISMPAAARLQPALKLTQLLIAHRSTMALAMKKTVMKSMKSATGMKAMKAMKVTKKKAVSKIAKGKGAKVAVFKGKKEKTVSWLKNVEAHRSSIWFEYVWMVFDCFRDFHQRRPPTCWLYEPERHGYFKEFSWPMMTTEYFRYLQMSG